MPYLRKELSLTTIINCHRPKNGPVQADFVNPATGQATALTLPDEQAAWDLADRLSASGKWRVTPSLSRGLWRAARTELLDRKCPSWQEKAEENAGANRR